MEATRVVFRKYKDGEIIALFPDLTEPGYLCTSYMHFGQHGAADYADTIARTKPATEDEYFDLKEELEEIGYVLKVVSRAVPKW